MSHRRTCSEGIPFTAFTSGRCQTSPASVATQGPTEPRTFQFCGGNELPPCPKTPVGGHLSGKRCAPEFRPRFCSQMERQQLRSCTSPTAETSLSHPRPVEMSKKAPGDLPPRQRPAAPIPPFHPRASTSLPTQAP